MEKVLKFLQGLETAGLERLWNGVAGVLVLCMGLAASELIRRVVRNWGEESGVANPAVLGRRAFFFCAAATGILALKHAGLETGLIEGVFHIVLGAAALAGALAAGLGARDLARNLVSGIYVREIYPAGSVLEIDGIEAALESVGPVAARLEKLGAGGHLIVPNSELVGRVVVSRMTSEQTEQPPAES